MKLLDDAHIVIGAFPVSIQGTGFDQSTYALGEAVNVSKYGHVDIILVGGAFAGTSAITVKQAATAATVSVAADNVTITSRYLLDGSAAASDTWTKTTVGSNTWTWPATANQAVVIGFDTASLNSGHDWIAINAVAAGGGASLLCAIYIMSESRYISAEDAPTVIV